MFDKFGLPIFYHRVNSQSILINMLDGAKESKSDWRLSVRTARALSLLILSVTCALSQVQQSSTSHRSNGFSGTKIHFLAAKRNGGRVIHFLLTPYNFFLIINKTQCGRQSVLIMCGKLIFKFYGCMLMGLGKKKLDFSINRFLKCGWFKMDS